MKTLVLIDGHSLAYRMHFALERTNMRLADRTPTWAVYGFFNALFSLLKKIRPDAMAVSFDVGRVTFRNDLYPEYKAHRDGMPDEMRTQMALIREGIEKLGIPIYEKEGYEADDVIGTLSCQAARDGYWVQILTGDQDAFQLVEDLQPADSDPAGRIDVLIPPRTPREDIKTYDREEVYKKWGIWPEQVTDFKGLKGDSSDNIPGVPGVGDKTACKLLTDYRDLETLYEHLADLPAGKLKERLETFREQAFLSKRLATIERNVPLSVNWDDCRLSIPDVPALMDYLEKMEFGSFIKQAPVLLAPFLESQAEVLETRARLEDQNRLEYGAVTTEPPEPHELPGLRPPPSTDVLAVPHQIVTTHAALQAMADQIRRGGAFAVDVETTGLEAHTAEMAGVAVTVGDGFIRMDRPAVNILKLADYPQSFPALAVKPGSESAPLANYYIPVRHPDLQSELDEAAIRAVLGPLLADEQLIKLIHNEKFEVNMFRQWGLSLGGLVFDTMLASYIEEPDRRHGLKSLSLSLLHQPMCEIKELIGSGKKAILFSEVPVDQAAAYAACDTYTTWQLARHFLSRLSESQWTLFYEIELPLARVLADVEWTGVALDTAYLKQLSGELEARLTVLESDICGLAGCTFNLNSPKQVGEVLFERLGIKPLRKTKGKTGYSTDVKVLEQLAGEYEIVRKMLEYRQLFKLKSTYIDTLPELINERTGRIHTSFNQTVTATGRLSSSNPNLQNIPIRSDLGRQIRQAFVPGERPGWMLISADYSQIELRLLAHFSEDPHLLEAFRKGEDVHTATAALVFGMDIDRVTKEQRYQAKTVNFGVIYGQSAYGLSQQLKIPQKEAAEFIQRYFSRYARVKGYIERIKAEAHRTGKVETLCGRVRDLSEGLQNSNRGVREFSERAAFNTPLQGSAADLMKVAMIRLHRRLREAGLQSKIILQVHDELVLEAPDHEIDTVSELVTWAMQLDQPLKVPLVVDVHVGPTWMES